MSPPENFHLEQKLVNHICTDLQLTFCKNLPSAKDKDNALWVKSGNRGNLKCLKVNDDFALIFHRKVFISFLSDSKLPEVLD